MRGIWFEEYERLWNECEDGEPDPDAVSEAVVDRLADAADRLRDQKKEESFK